MLVTSLVAVISAIALAVVSVSFLAIIVATSLDVISATSLDVISATSLDVIPAKAGIHLALMQEAKWIPASAGMTSQDGGIHMCA